MFIKISKLEQVLKKAYKGAGIRIERAGSRLIVVTARIYLEADIETVPNDFKAAVVRYTGQIPGDGESYTINEDQSQINIAGTHDLRLIQMDTLQGKRFNETCFTYMDDMVLQSDEDGQIITIPMKEWQVFDRSAVADEEDDPFPEWNRYEGGYITNRNDVMVIGFMYDLADDILGNLQDRHLT